MKPTSETLYECGHCKGEGTCTNGQNGTSCIVCAKENDLSWWRKKEGQVGLPCCVCGGLGKTESKTEKLNKRIGPALSLYLIGMLFLLILFALFYKPEFFGEILAFASAIIGSVTGFYFSSRSLGK